MAAEPTKKKRVQGPRVAKPKSVFLVSSQPLTDLTICDTAEDAMDVMMANPGWQVKKHVIPVKRRPTANQAPATPTA